MSRGTCTSCGAQLIWARTGSGKRIPLNAIPDPAGNVELDGGTAKTWGTSHVWPEGSVRYMPHHATCPTASQHSGAHR